MADPLRTDRTRAPDEAPALDRDAKIEQLLLLGLDHYFASEFEQAINVWTRALFLDRSHARARAYIERARGALAERQRESEELLQNGLAAFGRGAADEARQLLEAAIGRGAPRDEALAVLDRLNRLDAGSAAPARPASLERAARSIAASPLATGRPRRLGVWLMMLGLLASAGAALLVFLAPPIDWPSLSLLAPPASSPPPVAAAVNASLPIPLKAETSLARARALVALGHLHDALAALESIRSTDAQKAEADELRASIQRQLIALATHPVPAAQRGVGPLP